MEPRPDLKELCCVTRECSLYGQRGANNLTVRKTYGQDQIRYLRCRSCGEEFSERKGTALGTLKIPEARAADILDHLDIGCGVVSTAQVTKVSKDTVSRVIRGTGRASRRIHGQRVRNLTPQDDPTQAGDHWDVNSRDPHTKLLSSLVPGPRTAEALHQVVVDAASRLAPHAPQPAIFTDGEPAHPEMSLRTFGHYSPAPRRARTGRPPAPILRVPQKLGYAQVIKTKRKGRVVKVHICLCRARQTGPPRLRQTQATGGRASLGMEEGQPQCRRAR